MKKPTSNANNPEVTDSHSETVPSDSDARQVNLNAAAVMVNSQGQPGDLSKQMPRKFDPARLRLSTDFATLAGVTKHILAVPIRKPNRHEWVRFHPDEAWRIEVAALIWKEDRDTFYVVDPDLWPVLAMDTVPMLLVTTVNVQGAVFLTPIRLPGPDGRHNDWPRTLMLAANLGMRNNWIRVVANMSVGGYEVHEAPGDLGTATWPDMSFDKLLEVALRDYVIDTLDHPILKRLRGES